MKPMTVNVRKFDDFFRLAEAQQGVVFVEVGKVHDTLTLLANRPYPLVFECTVDHDSWHILDRVVRPIEANIELGE